MKTFLQNSFTLCPMFIGQKLHGTSLAPKILSEKLNKIKKFDHFLHHELKFSPGNSYFPGDHRQNLFNVLRHNRKIYNANTERFSDSNLNINLGGDHAIAIGSVSASLDKYKDDLVVVWIDAHADINSLYSSLTKNIHGIPLHILTNPIDYDLGFKKLKYKQIIYIGLRDCDYYEVKLINDKQIKHWSSQEVNQLDKTDRRDSFLKALKFLTKSKKIHLSLDVDALDPEYIPCTGISVDNGLTLDFVKDIIHTLKDDIINADIVELNLDLKTIEEQEKSLNNTIDLINTFIDD